MEVSTFLPSLCSMEGLSQEEAFEFLADVLKIDDPREKLNKDRLLFLEELLQAYLARLPFQNVTLLSSSPEQRHVPTWKEIRANIMQGRGGLCYTMSVYMKFLLDALEYKTCFLACSMRGFPDNHIATAVFDLTEKGSMHFVDPNAYPNFTVIPLDFEEESPVYEHSYLQFKFVKKGNVLLRLHRSTSHVTVLEDLSADQWFQVCEINLTPQELPYFEPSMNTVFTVPGKNSPFLVQFRAAVFTGLKLVAFKDKIMLLEREDHTLEEMKMVSREEMIGKVLKYFPQFTEAEVAKAIDSVRLFPIQ